MAARYGNPEVQTRDEYAQSSARGIGMMLTLVYALLALAVVIALLGIADTLTLALHERTRELGLLRAVGQTRAQLRAMVRWESVLVAAFGTAGGLALGGFLGWVLVKVSDGASDTAFAFALPPARLAVVVLAAGALAGLRPARRAARLDVLRAIATEWDAVRRLPAEVRRKPPRQVADSPPGQPGTAVRAGAGAAAEAWATTGVGAAATGAGAGCTSVSRGTGCGSATGRGERAGCRRAVEGAGSVNHTTLPSSPSGRAPQLSLIAATIARPRPQVARGATSVASATTGRRGS